MERFILRFSFLILAGLWCTNVLAHIPTWESKYPGDLNPFGVVEHFCPNTSADPCFTSKTCSIELEQYEGGHGHINDNGTWGYWSKGSSNIWEDGNALDCSPDDSPPEPKPGDTGGGRSTDHDSDGSRHLGGDNFQSERAGDHVVLRDDYGLGDCYEWNFIESPYISVPVQIEGVTNLITLRRYLNKRIKEYPDVAVFVDGRWVWYPSNREIGHTPITPNLGIRVGYKDAIVEVCGEPIAGEIVELTLPEGKKNAFYMVGFPELPANYEMRSDLLVDNLVWVQRRVWTGFYKNTKNEHVTRYHQDDDAEIEPGQAFFVRVNGDVTLDLRGTIPDVPSAPSALGRVTTTWGALKNNNQ